MDVLISKMAAAARIIADRICQQIQAAELIGVRLPRNYIAVMRERPVLQYGDNPVNAHTVTRETLLAFSADLMDGLLEEIAAFVEERQLEEEEALAYLEGLLE